MLSHEIPTHRGLHLHWTYAFLCLFGNCCAVCWSKRKGLVREHFSIIRASFCFLCYEWNIRFLLIGKMHGLCTKVARNPNMERLRNNYLFPEVGGLSITSRILVDWHCSFTIFFGFFPPSDPWIYVLFRFLFFSFVHLHHCWFNLIVKNWKIWIFYEKIITFAGINGLVSLNRLSIYSILFVKA